MKILNYILDVFIVSIVFFVLAKLGFTFAFIQSNVTLFWLPSGFSAAIILLHGYKYLPGICLGAFFANITTEAPIFFVLIATVANVLEPFLSAYLLKNKFKMKTPLWGLRDVFLFLIMAVLFSPIPSSILGSIGLCLNGMLAWDNIYYAISSWWAGDAFGILTLGSLILVWTYQKPLLKKDNFLEGFLLLIIISFIQISIHFEFNLWVSGKYLTWFVFPFLIWSTIRFNSRFSLLFAFIAMLIAVLGTVNGKGPFYTGEIGSSLLLLYSFISIVMVNTMVLAATIHERREKENMIINMHLERDTLFNSIDDLIWSIDRNFNLISANDFFLESIRINTGKIIQIGDNLFSSNTFSNELIEFWQGLYDRGFSGEIVSTEFSNNGQTKRWIDLKIKPICRENQIIGLACYGKDITERKKFEIDLQRMKEEAEAANAIKTQFISNMSHEIRTPLNAVLGFSDLLKSTNMDELQLKYLNTIQQSGNLLLAELNDLLDFGQLNLGKIQLQSEVVDLLSLLDQVTEIHKIKLKKDIQLHLIISEKTPHYIYTDSIRLRQILIHLLSNAIKFTERGEVIIEVTRDTFNELNKNEAMLLFSIRDTGIGISQEHQQKILNFFSQIDQSNNRQYGGIGLGLPIINKVLQLMDSKLEVNSELGRGSEFFFKLKIKIASESDVNRLLPPSISFFRKQQSLTILIADDDEINLMLIKAVISNILPNAALLEATNGKEALEICRKNKINLIFLDIQMPEMNGYEATREIRKINNFADIPIFAVTAGVTDETKQQCLNAGMNDYASKPFKKEKLEDLIARWAI